MVNYLFLGAPEMDVDDCATSKTSKEETIAMGLEPQHISAIIRY